MTLVMLLTAGRLLSQGTSEEMVLRKSVILPASNKVTKSNGTVGRRSWRCATATNAACHLVLWGFDLVAFVELRVEPPLEFLQQLLVPFDVVAGASDLLVLLSESVFELIEYTAAGLCRDKGFFRLHVAQLGA